MFDERWHSLMSEIRAEVLVIQSAEEGLGIQEKNGPKDIVTRADFAAEEMLKRFIADNYPEDGIYGEEGTAIASRSGYEWYLDPIDGTTCFRHRHRFFGISAGRVSADGNPHDGIVCCPGFDIQFSATLGEGAFINRRQPVRVDQNATLKRSIVGFGPREEHNSLYGPLRSACQNIMAIGSCVYESTLVIRGNNGAFVHTGATQFDVAAVSIIAKEAGCAVTPINLRHKVIPFAIAANQEILDEVVWICNREFPGLF